ncbi:MAG: hypothetical protein HY302_15200 [Opitutae bacterium]|nr:hypothetical protein [Opitutae bacterium]
MKKSSPVRSSLFAVAAAVAGGAALFQFGSAPIAAGLNGEIVLAVAASVAALLFAASDYSRRIGSLRGVTPLLRPSRPSRQTTRPSACADPRVRRSAIVDRAA